MSDAAGIKSFDRLAGVAAVTALAYALVVSAFGIPVQRVPVLLAAAGMLGVTGLSVAAVDVLLAYYDSRARQSDWRGPMDRTRIAAYSRILVYMGIITAVFAAGIAALAVDPGLQLSLLVAHIVLVVAVYWAATDDGAE